MTPDSQTSGALACVLDAQGVVAWASEAWRGAGLPAVGASYLRAAPEDLTAAVQEVLCGARDALDGAWSTPGRRDRVRAEAMSLNGSRCVHVQHELATAESDRYREFMEAAPDAAFLLAVDEDRPGRILDANTLAAESHGYTRGELIRMYISDLDAPSDASRVKSRIKQLLEDGFITFSATHRRRDGTEFPVEVSARTATIGGKPCVVSFNRDISERQAYEAKLRQNQIRLGLAARASQVGFWDWDMRSGKVVYSPEWKAQIGYEPDEIGDSLDEWESRVHPDDMPAARRAVEEHLDGTREFYTTEFRLRHKDGSYRSIYVRGVALRNADGEPAHFVGCHVDITARKLAEEARAEMSNRISQVQRLEAIGTLAGGIAHDFNNILTIIAANVDLAVADTQDASVEESLQEIRKASERAASLVRQILAFSRKESPKRKRVEIGPVVREAVALLRSTMPRSIELDVQIEPDVEPIDGDPEQLHQVLVNLGTNAWHAIGDGQQGTITFAVHRSSREPCSLVIEVQDDGSGMSPDTASRVFEPFFSTKPSDRGTGLGLSVVHGIVQSHQGSIEVDSEEGVGSTFRVALPAAEDAAPAEPASSSPGALCGRVLLLDDETALVRALTNGLRRLGLEVVGYDDPRAALAAFEQEPFDAVVTDHDMPDLAGTDVVRLLRQRAPDLPIVMCSGFLTEQAQQDAIAAGANRILSKPILADALARTLAEVMARLEA